MESNSINVRGYGSLTCAIYNQAKSLTPEVGMGVTEIMFSDRHPYTVTKIITPKLIEVQADKSIRIDKNGCCEAQLYEYTLDTNGPSFRLRLNNTGRWKRIGDAKGSTYLIGRREEYYDFTR